MAQVMEAIRGDIGKEGKGSENAFKYHFSKSLNFAEKGELWFLSFQWKIFQSASLWGVQSEGDFAFKKITSLNEVCISWRDVAEAGGVR